MKESADEKMTDRAAEAQSSSGHPKKTPLSVSSTLPPGMKTPMAPGESAMGGVKKGDSAGGNDSHLGNSNLGSAVAQLNYETERGSHAPAVGGHSDAGTAHCGVMKKA